MQPVQGYLCMMVLLQGVGCNLCFVCVSFFIVFKSIKRLMHNVGCIGCVTISTRTGVYEFRSVTCIKGYVFSLQTTHILFCQRAWYCCVRLSLLWAGTSFVCDPVGRTLLGSQTAGCTLSGGQSMEVE